MFYNYSANTGIIKTKEHRIAIQAKRQIDDLTITSSNDGACNH